MPFPILPSNSATGYFLNKSLRFRSNVSAYLNRTPASATNRKTWTWSAWVKRGTQTEQMMFGCGVGGSDDATYTYISFGGSNSDQLTVNGYTQTWKRPTQLFRDFSAWYHIIVALDTTQSTADDRIKIYVNGSQVTSFTISNNPSQNSDLSVNRNASHTISSRVGYGSDSYFDGYMAEVNFIDGQQLTPSSFGSYNSLTGVWQPAKYTGTYGTNGFYLPFTDTTSTTTLGYDFSGNSNNWTTNNISLTAGTTYDSMNDVPTLTSATTANYCVLNPVDKDPDITMSNGNLTATAATGVHNNARTTMGCGTTGYWYMEFTYTGSIGGSTAIAVGLYDPAFRIDNGTHPVTTGDGFYGLYASAGAPYMYTDGGNPSVAVNGGSAGDILQLAYDVAGGKLWFGLNNVWYDSSGGTTGNPSTGANATITTVATNRIFGFDIVSNTINFNFGQRPFAYTPPTGFLALNTYNLPTSTIVKGNKVMDATTYTGTNATQSIVNGGGFKPDLVWIKTRSVASRNTIFDSVRGITKVIWSNSADAEGTANAGTGLTAFASNGFTLGTEIAGTSGSTNGNADTLVGWQWQAGQGTTSSNTQGSVTSTVSVNPTAGFSVFTFNSGSAGTQTVGHGLGVYPGMVVFKDRAGGYWNLWHSAFSNPAQGYMYLDLTNGVANDASQWSNTAPTSSVFTYNSDYSWTANRNMVAYAWASIAGYSAFGSYTGNGSTDGPFTYLGFRPKFVMVKKSSAAQGWYMYDSSRGTYNVIGPVLEAQSSASEGTASLIDFLSNGFKIRESGNGNNTSGGTYIYAAFAENPFKNALAR